MHYEHKETRHFVDTTTFRLTTLCETVKHFSVATLTLQCTLVECKAFNFKLKEACENTLHTFPP